MAVTFIPPAVASTRVQTYERFVSDTDIPQELRLFAMSIYVAFRERKIPAAQCAELALQMVRFYVAYADERAEMVARGTAKKSEMLWRDYRNTRSRARGV